MSWLLAYWKPALIAVVCSLAVWWFSHQRYNAGYGEANAAWALKWQQRDAADATALGTEPGARAMACTVSVDSTRIPNEKMAEAVVGVDPSVV